MKKNQLPVNQLMQTRSNMGSPGHTENDLPVWTEHCSTTGEEVQAMKRKDPITGRGIVPGAGIPGVQSTKVGVAEVILEADLEDEEVEPYHEIGEPS